MRFYFLFRQFMTNNNSHVTKNVVSCRVKKKEEEEVTEYDVKLFRYVVINSNLLIL